VPPTDVEIPPTARWKYGYDEDEAMPTNKTEELKKELRIQLGRAGRLHCKNGQKVMGIHDPSNNGDGHS
jgi:hypothetical protein